MIVHATLDGQPFPVDPTSIRWSYSLSTMDVPTIGGKVVQVFGTQLDDMVVTGTFSGYYDRNAGRHIQTWEQQLEFLEWMKSVGNHQIKEDGGGPVRFMFPPRGLDFLVYLKAYTEPGSGRSIHLENSNFAPKYQLTFMIEQDNTGLAQVAQDIFIKRIAEGIGWEQTRYNGGVSMSDVRDVLTEAGVSTIDEYAAQSVTGPTGGTP